MEMNEILKKMRVKSPVREIEEIESPVQEMDYSDLTPADLIDRIKELGSEIELVGDRFKIAPPLQDKSLVEAIKENRDRILYLLHQRSDRVQFNHWQDLVINLLIQKVMQEFATIKAVYESGKKEPAYKAAINSIADGFEALASSIREEDSKRVWELADDIRWMVNQIKSWSRNPSETPPKELFLDVPK